MSRTSLSGSVFIPQGGTKDLVYLRIIPLDSRGNLLYKLGETSNVVSGAYDISVEEGYYHFDWKLPNTAWTSLGKGYVTGSSQTIQDVLELERIDKYGVGLDNLSDVTITSPSTGDTLRYEGGKWINTDPSTSSIVPSASNSTTASYALTAQTLLGSIESASFASTASYLLGASETSSYALSAKSASYAPSNDEIVSSVQTALDTKVNNSQTSSMTVATASFATIAASVVGGTENATSASYSAYADSASVADYAPTNAGVATETYTDNAVDTLSGSVADDIDTHITDTTNPHSVTATQVGLGNVDNTSDANKPISTATQAALDLKVNISETSSMSVATSSLALNVVGGTESSSYAETASYAILAKSVEGGTENATSASLAQTARTASYVEWSNVVNEPDFILQTESSSLKVLSASYAPTNAGVATETFVTNADDTLSSSLATDIATKTTETYVDGEITTLSSSIASDIINLSASVGSDISDLETNKLNVSKYTTDSGSWNTILDTKADTTYVDSEISTLSGSVALDISELEVTKATITYVDTEINSLSGSVGSDISDLESNKLNVSKFNTDSGSWNTLIDSKADTTYVDSQDTSLSSSLASDISTNANKLSTIETGATADQSGSDVPLSSVNGATYTSVQQMQDVYHSSGLVSGGTITDAGGGTIDVSAGEGYIRPTDNRLDTLSSMAFGSVSGLTLTDNSLNYIYVFYNSGTPTVQASTSVLNTNNYMLLGTVFREGTTLHITETNAYFVGDHAVQMIKRLQNTAAFARQSGGVISEVGTRNIAITAGTWWEGLNQFTTPSIDTSVADTFTYYYRDGVGGFTAVTAQTQIDNLQYDDGTGTLATLANVRYGVHWVYLGTDGDVYILFGRGSYTLTEAEAASAPSTTPDFFTKHARLIGRIIILKSDTTFTEISSVFDTTFNQSAASNHNDLGGIQGGTTDEYFHLTNTELGYVQNIPNISSSLDNVSSSFSDFSTGSYVLDSDLSTATVLSSSFSITASYSQTAQTLLGAVVSASYAVTASYALNGGGGDVETSSLFKVVQHGSDANVERPSHDAVYWIGSVEPNNSVANDFWRDTTKTGSFVDSASFAATASFTLPFAVVEHGATAGTARPSSTVVYWIGTVEPTNATNADMWFSGSI